MEADHQNEATDDADQAAQVAEADTQETNLGDEDDNGDIEDAMLNNLRSYVPPNHDWSSNYDETKTSALSDYAKEYYARQNAAINNNGHHSTDDATLQEFDPEVLQGQKDKSWFFFTTYSPSTISNNLR